MSTKQLLVAVAVVLAAAAPAMAQFGTADAVAIVEPLAGDAVAVHDIPSEQNTAAIAQSVTTGGGSGTYASNTGTIADLNATLWTSMDPQKLSTLYPGWQPWSANSSAENASLTTTTLSTYQNAMAVAQRQTQEIQNENFSAIESNLSSTNVLTVLQAIGEAQLQVAQQIQYQRQLEATLIAIEVTQAAETLNEKSREAATNQRTYTNLFTNLF